MRFQGNQTSGRMSLRVLGPNGAVLLDKADFVDLSQSSYYHPPTYGISVTGHLDIPDGLGKGIYTEQYVVTDNNAGQTIGQEAKFEVK